MNAVFLLFLFVDILCSLGSTVSADLSSTVSADLSSTVSADLSSTVSADLSSTVSADLSSTVFADCTCNGYINERGQGECKTRYRGKEFCYVNSGTCSDQKKSSSASGDRWWSYGACQTSRQCSTVTGKTCQLPFRRYKGKTFSSCTTVDSANGLAWCATSVAGSERRVVRGSYEDCAPPCGAVQPPTCAHKGETYQHGATFNDGCNNCKCNRDGSVVCTEKLCLPTTCEHEDNIYQVGDTFPQHSGFCPAQCECKEEVLATLPPRVKGTVFCLPTSCPPPTCEHKGQYYHEGDHFKDNCNQCTCKQDGSVPCTKIFCFGK